MTKKKEFKGWAVVVKGELINVYLNEVSMNFWTYTMGIKKGEIKKVKIIIEE